MRFIEQLLMGLETRPWDILYRAVVGFATLALFVRVRSGSGSDWVLAAVLLAVFVALRVVAAIARRVLPFSDAARRIWTERRQLAKKYDSYQWQKLLGFGVGLALYVAVSQQFSIPRTAISAACVLAGLIGAMKWHATAQQIESARVHAKQ
jgi:DMSO reductase anchor subunit